MSAKQCDCIRNLLRLPDSSVRIQPSQVLDALLGLVFLEQLGAGGPGSNAVDADALFPQVLGHDACNLLDRTLGREVWKIRRRHGGSCNEGG